jgi:hypothetical protein
MIAGTTTKAKSAPAMSIDSLRPTGSNHSNDIVN